VILLNWTMDNVRINKIQKCNAPSSISFRCIMYSITENIYYSQLSSVAILLQPEPVFTSYSTRKDWVLSPNVLSPCGLPLPPMRLLVTANESRSYFASTISNGLLHSYVAFAYSSAPLSVPRPAGRQISDPYSVAYVS
jgi:hypothetical protein